MKASLLCLYLNLICIRIYESDAGWGKSFGMLLEGMRQSWKVFWQIKALSKRERRRVYRELGVDPLIL